MVLDVSFISRKIVDSQKTGKMYFFADFMYGQDIFSAFLPVELFDCLDSCTLGQRVSLIYEPRVYGNKLQFNLTKIEVM